MLSEGKYTLYHNYTNFYIFIYISKIQKSPSYNIIHI